MPGDAISLKPGSGPDGSGAVRGAADELVVVARRHPWRWVSALIALTIAALLLRSIAANPKMQWDVVGEYFFNGRILGGLAVTIELTVICQSLAILLGIVLALMRLSRNPVLQGLSWLYIWFFRGTPLLVQLVFWYNLGLLFPRLGLTIGGTPISWSVDTNTVITSFTAAILGLTLHESAFMTEIIRGGILGVDKGQAEAAHALGLNGFQTMRRIVLPQTLRIVVPPTGNQLINMLKMTSLVAFIAGGDLLTVAANIYSTSFLVIPLLVVASLWYLVATSVASLGQHFIEKKYGKAFMAIQA